MANLQAGLTKPMWSLILLKMPVNNTCGDIYFESELKIYSDTDIFTILTCFNMLKWIKCWKTILLHLFVLEKVLTQKTTIELLKQSVKLDPS